VFGIISARNSAWSASRNAVTSSAKRTRLRISAKIASVSSTAASFDVREDILTCASPVRTPSSGGNAG
jgi:hypothetical protein